MLSDFLNKKLLTKKYSGTNMIGKLKRKDMPEEIAKLIFDKLELKVNNILTSDRFILNNRIFHSKSYLQKGNCNSYTVSYKQNNTIKYGDIEYFVEINNQYYAIIRKHSLKVNVFDLLPESSGYFFEMAKKYFSKYFKIIEYSNQIDLIDCFCIKDRCIIIQNKELYLTELEYEFEHD